MSFTVEELLSYNVPYSGLIQVREKVVWYLLDFEQRLKYTPAQGAIDEEQNKKQRFKT